MYVHLFLHVCVGVTHTQAPVKGIHTCGLITHKERYAPGHTQFRETFINRKENNFNRMILF